MTNDLKGLKNTKNRKLILDCLNKLNKPVTAEELYFLLKDENVDLSTIYRTLNSFYEKGIVKKEINSSKKNIFIVDNDNDSHVLVCKICHKRIPLHGCPYHKVNKKIEKATGFIVEDQNTEIYGVCPECQKKINKK